MCVVFFGASPSGNSGLIRGVVLRMLWVFFIFFIFFYTSGTHHLFGMMRLWSGDLYPKERPNGGPEREEKQKEKTERAVCSFQTNKTVPAVLVNWRLLPRDEEILTLGE